MTDYARRALRALPRLPGQSTASHVEASRVPVPVEIRAPEDLLERCTAEASDTLADALRRTCGELRVPSTADITFVPAPAAHPDVEISIGGRPVALVATETVARSGVPADQLCYHALQGVLRRLPLLLPAESNAGVTAYLLAIGCALPEVPAHADSVLETAEQLIDVGLPDEIVLEVSAETMRRVDREGQRVVAEFRETEFRRRGIRYPDIRVELRDDIPCNPTIRLNNVTVPMAPLSDGADWAAVVDQVSDQLTARRHWFVRTRQVEDLLTYDLGYLFPKLVSAARSEFTIEEATACLRELLRSGRRIRNLPQIIWFMLEQGDAHGTSDMLRLSESPLTPWARHARAGGRDPKALAARVRKIGNEEAWRLGKFRTPVQARRLHPHLEARLVNPDDAAAVAVAEWEVARAVAADPEAERIITRTIEAIGPVRDAVQALERPLRVMASQELPPDADLEQFVVIGPERQESSSPRMRYRPSRRRL